MARQRPIVQAVAPDDASERDLFLALGEVVGRQGSGLPLVGICGQNPTLLESLISEGGPLVQRYLPPEKLPLPQAPDCPPGLKPVHDLDERWLASVSLIGLEEMKSQGSQVLRDLHLLDRPLFVGAAVAAAVASVVLANRGGYECTRGLLQWLGKRPSGWGSSLDDLEAFALQPGSPVDLQIPSDSSNRLDIVVNATNETMRYFGFGVKSGRRSAQGQRGTPRNGPSSRGVSSDREPPLLFEDPVLTLADVALERVAMEELEFVVALGSKEPQAAPVLLFHGPPGTGKSHAASCLAGALGRSLATTNVPGIMDPLVGMIERNLARAFEEARKANAVLLLDECDSLVHDRRNALRSWESSQVNTLLKQLERPGVPVILATNFFDHLDQAVMRRIDHLIGFKVPDFETRKRLWRLEVAAQGLKGDFDFDALAEIVLTGGLIRNASRTAFRRSVVAGDAGKTTSQALLTHARQEVGKMPQGGLQSPTIGFRAS